ncbi:MAG: isoprenylcysteine carboxylmethyltransferase family protein [Planctomycetota bacterium]|nr:MAG: isoprenylcysteine carboxylmethyltransferase family protein [Planctomycetota bacterium]
MPPSVIQLDDALAKIGLSSPVSEDPARSVKSSFVYRNRMIVTGISIGAGLVLLSFQRPWPRQNPALEWCVELIGWVLFWSGAIIRIWASTYICASKSRSVVSTGPYSLCRNPLYWGTFLMLSGFPFLIRNPWLALFLVPPIGLYLWGVVPVEELVMKTIHGAEYEAYCRKVPRWCPRFSGYARGEALDGHAVGYYRECLRLFWWLGFAITLDLLFRYLEIS